jgi:hypothetical protein
MHVSDDVERPGQFVLRVQRIGRRTTVASIGVAVPDGRPSRVGDCLAVEVSGECEDPT